MVKTEKSVPLVTDKGVERAADMALCLSLIAGITFRLTGTPLPAIVIVTLVATAIAYAVLHIRRWRPLRPTRRK